MRIETPHIIGHTISSTCLCVSGRMRRSPIANSMSHTHKQTHMWICTCVRRIAGLATRSRDIRKPTPPGSGYIKPTDRMAFNIFTSCLRTDQHWNSQFNSNKKSTPSCLEILHIPQSLNTTSFVGSVFVCWKSLFLYLLPSNQRRYLNECIRCAESVEKTQIP